MRRQFFNRPRRNVWTGMLLVLLLVRAHVPVGFMPAPGSAFSLELCPAEWSVPVALHASEGVHHHHDADLHAASPNHHSGMHGFESCPFGSAPAAGPISQFVAFAPPGRITDRVVFDFETWLAGLRPARAHQPRGPPSLV